MKVFFKKKITNLRSEKKEKKKKNIEKKFNLTLIQCGDGIFEEEEEEEEKKKNSPTSETGKNSSI